MEEVGVHIIYLMLNLLQNPKVVNFITKSVRNEEDYHFMKFATWTDNFYHFYDSPKLQTTSTVIVFGIQSRWW